MPTRFAVTAPIGPTTSDDVARANEILENRFSFYGEKHQLPPTIDWTFNPGTAHWSHDLNRFSFLEVLTRSYLQSGDQRYVKKVLELIFSWIAQAEKFDPREPEKAPYIWNSYLNIALHLVQWVACLAVIDERAPHLLPDEEYSAIVVSIEMQLEWLDEVIPTHRNNWVQIGCRGVLLTLAALPHLSRGRQWSTRAWQRMSDAIAAQLLPDGVQDEMAVSYHYVVVIFALDALECAEQTPTPPPPKLFDQVASMLHYLRQTLTPDGEYIVALNDSDPQYGEATRRLLARPLAQQMLAKVARPLENECFPFAGIMLLRAGEAQGRDELYLAFDGGSFGTAHQHEDKLAVSLSALGRSFLVDPGRHLYDRSEVSFWPFLKTTQAHSTITIDGQGQNARASKAVPGAWRSEEAQPILFEKRPEGSCVAGAFYDLGYGEEKTAVMHFRLVFFFPDLGAWAIADAVEGVGVHAIDSRFQFVPGEVTTKNVSVRTQFADANLLIQGRAADWQSVRVAQGEREPRAGWFSKGINQIEAAPCAVFSTGTRALPWHGVMALLPFRGSDTDTDTVAQILDRAEKQYVSHLEKLRALQTSHNLSSRLPRSINS